MDPTMPAAAEEPPAKRAAISQWAQENPAAFGGLWFAVAASLLTTRLLHFLPGIAAQAYSMGGTEAWTWGALGLGYVYFMPGLLALLIGMPLARPIVAGAEPHGWEAALRGALIGSGSLSAWLLTGPLLVRLLLPESLLTAGDPLASVWGMVGLLWLLLTHLVVAAIGGWVGYLLHVFCRRSAPGPVVEVAGAARVQSGRER